MMFSKWCIGAWTAKRGANPQPRRAWSGDGVWFQREGVMEGEEIKETEEEWNVVNEKGDEVETKEKEKMTPEDIIKKAL